MALLSVRYSFLLDSNAGTWKNIKPITFFVILQTAQTTPGYYKVGGRGLEEGICRLPSFRVYILYLFHLSLGELLEEIFLFVGDAEFERRVDFDIGSAILGRYKGLVRPEVVQIRVQGLKNNRMTAMPTGWPG